MSNPMDLFKALIPPANTAQNSNTVSNQPNGNFQTEKVIVTTNTVTTSNYKTQQTTNQNNQTSSNYNKNEGQGFSSPQSWKPSYTNFVSSNPGAFKQQFSTIQNKNTYIGSITPVTNSYKVQEKTVTYQSPQQIVTTFNPGSYASPNIRYDGGNNLGSNSDSKNYTYSYKKIIEQNSDNKPYAVIGSSFQENKRTPISNLGGDKNKNQTQFSKELKYFHSYSKTPQQKRTPTNKVTFSTSNQYNAYQPITTGVATSLPYKFEPLPQYSISSSLNQQIYQPSTSYQFQSANKTFTTPVATTTIQTTNYAPYNPVSASFSNQKKYTTITYQQPSSNLNYSFQNQGNYVSSNSINLNQNNRIINEQKNYNVVASNMNKQTVIQNRRQNVKVEKKEGKVYEVLDQIQRPQYEKLYANEEEERRLKPKDDDPPVKSSICTPFCWVPLLIIGFLLALLGMLCGLGIICPGIPGIIDPQTSGAQGIKPLIIPQTTLPSKQTPNQHIPLPNPQTVKPSAVLPNQITNFNTGTPSNTANISQRSYIPPISMAPNYSPMDPLDPSYKANVIQPATMKPIQKPVQFQPQTIKYEKKMDQYWIQAQPTIVGVVTHVNNQTIPANGTRISAQYPINSYTDYSSNRQNITSTPATITTTPVNIVPSIVPNVTTVNKTIDNNISYVANNTSNVTVTPPFTAEFTPSAIPLTVTNSNNISLVQQPKPNATPSYIITSQQIVTKVNNVSTIVQPEKPVIKEAPSYIVTTEEYVIKPAEVKPIEPSMNQTQTKAIKQNLTVINSQANDRKPWDDALIPPIEAFPVSLQTQSKNLTLSTVNLTNVSVIPVVNQNRQPWDDALIPPIKAFPVSAQIKSTNLTISTSNKTDISAITATKQNRQPWDDALIPPIQPSIVSNLQNTTQIPTVNTGNTVNTSVSSAKNETVKSQIDGLTPASVLITPASSQSFNASALFTSNNSIVLQPTSLVVPNETVSIPVASVQSSILPASSNTNTSASANANASVEIKQPSSTNNNIQWNDAIYLPIGPIIFPTQQIPKPSILPDPSITITENLNPTTVQRQPTPAAMTTNMNMNATTVHIQPSSAAPAGSQIPISMPLNNHSDEFAPIQ